MVISASPMPPERMRGSPRPLAVMALNAWMMPATVPSRPEQRRDRGDGAERVEKSLQLVHHVPAAVLQPLHHQRARLVAVRKPDGQKLAERRVLLQSAITSFSLS